MVRITIRGTEYTCTLSERFRRHTPAELERMRESVAGRGIQVPVCLYFDTTLGLDDCVLDGEGRLTTLAALAMPTVGLPVERYGRMSTDDAYELAKVLNDHRRQDSPEAIQRRRAERIVRVAGARAEGKSLRAIAEQEGVSLGQVQRDIQEATVSGDTVAVGDRVTGLDGKSRPATRPAPSEESEPETPAPQRGVTHPVATIQAVPDSRPHTPPVEPDPPHPFEELRKRCIALQRDIKAALNADTPEGSRLRELMTLARVVRHPATPDGGKVEFLPLLGIPLLLRLVIEGGTELSGPAVVQKYMAATGSWVPPWIELQKQKRARRAYEG